MPLDVLAERMTSVSKLPYTPADVENILKEVEDNAYDTCGTLTDQEIVNVVTQDVSKESTACDEAIDDDQTPTESHQETMQLCRGTAPYGGAEIICFMCTRTRG